MKNQSEENKKKTASKDKKKGKTLFVGGITFIVLIAIVAVVLIINGSKQEELNKIFSTFTCNSCEGTLLANEDFNALGIKQTIEEFQKQGFKGEALFDKTTMLLGVMNIIDPDLKLETVNKFRENPPKDRAIITLDEDTVNFGNISESKIAFVMKDFTIKNTGTEDLYIYQLRTSCSCLNTKLVTEEKESPILARFSFPYGMTVKIPPNEEMRLRVTYDARVNSFFRGFETRFVYIETNDVISPTYQITVDVFHMD